MADKKLNPRTKRVRDALIQATQALVSEKPVAEISITEIATKAQVSRPVVYNQFADTPSLVSAAAQSLMEEFFAAIDDELPCGSDVEHLEKLLGLFVGKVYEQRDFCRNAMLGPSSASIIDSVSRMLAHRMASGLIGQRLRSRGAESQDCLTTLSVGVIWLLVKWLESDFEGENEPKAMAHRFVAVLLSLTE